MKPSFSICIPSYNNLEYLKLCTRSLRNNTASKSIEIIVHDNGSTDGTKEWLEQNSWIKHTRSETNLGFCAVNNAIKLATGDLVWIFNSDMYALPGWDADVIRQIGDFKRNGVDRFTISCCLIEPSGNNPEFTIANFGTEPDNFREEDLLRWFLENKNKIAKPKTKQFSHPIVIPKFMLDEIGGFDEKYFPGYTSDFDLGRSLYERRCKNFVMLGSSRIYHFISKGFSNLSISDRMKSGHDIFFKKWGEHPEHFRQRINIKSNYIIEK